MKSKVKNVRYIRSDNSIGTAIIEYIKTVPIKLSITADNKQYIENESTDLYEGLRRVRKLLEVDGIKLMCNGAARNVRPSAMQRDMAVGELGYLLILGEKKPQFVNIFDENMEIDYATGEEQETFYKEIWRKSIT